MAIQHIALKDCLDRAEPPEKVLTLTVIDDTAFVSISAWEEGSDHSSQEAKAYIAVSSASLHEALGLLRADAAREDLRPLDPPGNDKGQRSARIAGHRAGMVRL